MAEFPGVTLNYLLSGRDEDINVDTLLASEIKLVRLYRSDVVLAKECLMQTATLFANAIKDKKA